MELRFYCLECNISTATYIAHINAHISNAAMSQVFIHAPNGKIKICTFDLSNFHSMSTLSIILVYVLDITPTSMVIRKVTHIM